MNTREKLEGMVQVGLDLGARLIDPLVKERFSPKCSSCRDRKAEKNSNLCKECASDGVRRVVKVPPEVASELLANQMRSSVPLCVESESFQKPSEPSVPIPPGTFSTTPKWTNRNRR